MYNSNRTSILVAPLQFVPCTICAVDQFLNNQFNMNDFGWLRNDISALAAASTREQYEEILRRLKELPATSSIPDNLPLQDAFDVIKPRYMQTENEFVEFVGFMTEKGMKNAEKAYAAEVARHFTSQQSKAKEVTNTSSSSSE